MICEGSAVHFPQRKQVSFRMRKDTSGFKNCHVFPVFIHSCYEHRTAVNTDRPTQGNLAYAFFVPLFLATPYIILKP